MSTIANLLKLLLVHAAKKRAKNNAKAATAATAKAPKRASVKIEPFDEYETEIVGESHYQTGILELLESGQPVYEARLVCERGNPHDPNAVAVFIGKLKVGHLARGDAEEYREALREYASNLPPATVMAKLVGGKLQPDGTRTHIGVLLDTLMPPEFD